VSFEYSIFRMSKTVQLTQNQTTVVDDDDFESVSQVSWRAVWIRDRFYAAATIDGKTVYLHSWLTGYEKTDHHNRDSLDNTRVNLRLANDIENQGNRGPNKNNTSGYKGVVFDKSRGNWRAKMAGRTVGGRFNSPEDAAHAYDEAAQKHFGEFAQLNFPEDLK
jgi:AP2 domain